MPKLSKFKIKKNFLTFPKILSYSFQTKTNLHSQNIKNKIMSLKLKLSLEFESQKLFKILLKTIVQRKDSNSDNFSVREK